MTPVRKLRLLVCVFPLLAGCAATGEVDDPVVRRVTWFSFLSGDDLRAACVSGRTDLRLVHNAIWDEDVRVIEAKSDGQGGMAVREQLFLRVDWSSLSIDLSNPRAPWHGETVGGAWTATQAAGVVAALEADRAFVPLEKPLQLAGQGFFWTGAGCRDGRFWFHAWGYPSAEYEALVFPNVVQRLLPSKGVFAEAYDVTPAYPDRRPHQDRSFFLTAEAGGIAGRLDLPAPPVSGFLP
jgi:hypothetical protein